MPFLIFAILFYVLAVAFCTYAFACYFIYKGWNNPPYIPSFGKTKKAVIAEVSKLLKNSKKSLNVADLGCGDGSLLAGLSPNFLSILFSVMNGIRFLLILLKDVSRNIRIPKSFAQI